MKALTWQGKRTIEYSKVPDLQIQEPTDIIKVTSTANCRTHCWDRRRC
ncbi:hypothetical protein [Arthrobacter sp. H35-D1]